MDQYSSTFVHTLHKSKQLSRFGFASKATFVIAGGRRWHCDCPPALYSKAPAAACMHLLDTGVSKMKTFFSFLTFL